MNGESELTGLAQSIFNSLAANAEKTAIVNNGQPVTYRKLATQSARLAEIFRDHGLTSGQVAIFCQPDNADILVSILAAWRIGATPLVVDFRTPGMRRAAIAKATQAAILIESRRPAGMASYESILWESDWIRPNHGMQQSGSIPIDFSHPAFMTLSSGTTGSPKIYAHSHATMLASVSARAAALIGAGNTFLTPMGLSFSATRNIALAYLIAGGVVYFEPPLFSTGEIIEKILETRISGAAFPPPIIRNMVKEAGHRTQPLFPDLKMLRSIGGPATVSDILSAYRFLTNGYNMAFGSGLTGYISLLTGPDVLLRPESVGRIPAAVKVDFLHPSTLEMLPPGQPGLIRVRSPFIAETVIESNAGANAERYGPGWGIPGDIGILDDQGYLTIVGREGDMIVRGGVSVAPQEIEAELERDQNIRQVGVVGIDDPDYGQEIAAFVVSDTAKVADIQALCVKTFPPDRRPRIIKLVDQLPYNTNGKLMRHKLSDLL